MKDTDDIHALMAAIGARAKAAAADLAFAPSDAKRAALLAAADAVDAHRADIVAANAKDMAYGRDKGLSAAMLDRLFLDDGRIDGIVDGLRAVADQADPVGAVLAEWDMPSGLHIRRVRTPLGVVGVIYESRPNVTADAGALCLKSGNAVILRGGSESFHSSRRDPCLPRRRAARRRACPRTRSSSSRPATARRCRQMLGMVDYIDVIVPRGGKGLVGLVQREARVPVFAHLEGIVHIYLDAAADPEKAVDDRAQRQDPPHRHLRRGRMPADPSRHRGAASGATSIARAARRGRRGAGGRDAAQRCPARFRRPRTTGGTNTST